MNSNLTRISTQGYHYPQFREDLEGIKKNESKSASGLANGQIHVTSVVERYILFALFV